MQNWESGPSQFLPSNLSSAIAGTQSLPTERLRLRGASESGEAVLRRVLAEIGQPDGLVESLGDKWELRAERLGGRSLLLGLYSQPQGDWLAWVADSASVEVTLDILGQFNSRPVLGIIPHRDSYCLLIQRLTFHGTGAERHSEIWHVLRGKELVEVLRYPTHAYVSGWCSFQREIRAIPLQKPKVLKHGARLEILFRADYFIDSLGAGERAVNLLSEERIFRAVWDDDAELFVPTPNSQLSAADVEALFDEGDEGFFCRHRQLIEELLVSEVKEHRLWAEKIHGRFAI